MGELKQRGQIWWIRYYRGGVRYEESSGSERKGAAIDLLRIREGDVAKGLPVTSKLARVRFDEAMTDVVNDYRTNGKRSAAHVERRIEKHLTPFFAGRRVVSITTADIRAFIAHRQAASEMVRRAHDVTRADGTTMQIAEQRRTIEGASNAEINRELAILKRAYRLAIQAGKLLHAPYIPMLREDNVRQGFFERQEFEDVRASLPTALQPVATFAYLTGWRVPSEVLPLQWSQIDRIAKLIRLEPGTTKNDGGRTFPYALLPELADTLEAQWTAHEALLKMDVICPFVFQRDGKRIRDFRDAWQAACEGAGVPGKIPHDFRRTAVRNLVRAGVPEKTAMLLTGHKTRSVFDRYDIVNEADLREAVGKLAATVPGTKQGQSARSGRIRRFRKSS